MRIIKLAARKSTLLRDQAISELDPSLRIGLDEMKLNPAIFARNMTKVKNLYGFIPATATTPDEIAEAFILTWRSGEPTCDIIEVRKL